MDHLNILDELKDIHQGKYEGVKSAIQSGSYDNLNSIDLCKIANSHFIELNFASCTLIFKHYFPKFKEDAHFLYCFGYFTCEAGILSLAEQLLKRSVELSPETDFRKYLILADMYKSYQPEISLKLYEKGITLAIKDGEDLNKELSSNSIDNERGRKINNKLNDYKRTLSLAYCAVAELMMNSPEFPKNRQNIEEALRLSEESDGQYIEHIYQRCYLYFNLEDENSCRKEISRFVEGIKKIEENNDEDLLDYPAEMLVGIVRMMIEGAIWEDGAYLAEIACQNDGKSYEAVYMLAFCGLNMGDTDLCREYLEKMQSFDLTSDQEMAEAVEELREELKVKENEMGDKNMAEEDQNWKGKQKSGNNTMQIEDDEWEDEGYDEEN